MLDEALLSSGQGTAPSQAAGTGSNSAARTAPSLPLETVRLTGDTLPLETGSIDAVVSPLGLLHWVNDLPGLLSECRRVLKPDGLFLGAMVGGNTLQELRIALSVAELEREGGVSIRVSPMARGERGKGGVSIRVSPMARGHRGKGGVSIRGRAVLLRIYVAFLANFLHLPENRQPPALPPLRDSLHVSVLAVRDGGNLLERAGFALPTVDVDDIEVVYPTMVDLVRHLRSIGESNSAAARRRTLVSVLDHGV